MRVIDTPTTHQLFVFFFFFHSPYWISFEPRALYLEYKSVNPYVFVRRSFMENLERSKMKLIKCIIRCC